MHKHPQVAFKIVAKDKGDITDIVSRFLISLTIEDKRGLEIDSLNIELTDPENTIMLPDTGGQLQVWIGWKHTGLVYKGSFTVTEVRHSGPPDIISIKAISIDLKKGFKRKQERSWHNKTIGDVIAKIAQEYSMEYAIDDDLKDVNIAHIDQNESDASFIARLAEEHNAIATVKNNFIIFLTRNQGLTANGLELPTYTITRTVGDSHEYIKHENSDDISGVIARYYDPNDARIWNAMVGDGAQNPKELRHIFKDRESATNYATSEFLKIKAAAASFSVNLAYGVPDLIPEMPIRTMGFKPEIDEVMWIGVNIAHKIDNSGYTTRITAELMMPDADDFALLSFDEPEDYTGVVAYYKHNKTTQKVMIGDMTTPKRLAYLYANERTATVALNREWVRIQAEKGIEVKPSELRKVTTQKAQSKRKNKKSQANTSKKTTQNRQKPNKNKTK